MKTKIKMKKNSFGCEDGFTSRHYKEGEVYELPNHLAHNFIADDVAEHHEKEKQSHSNKAQSDDDYENKSVKPNKRKGEKS